MKILILVTLFSLSCVIAKAQNVNSVLGKGGDYTLEHPPEYPGGMNGFLGYLNSHVRYPRAAQRNHIEGKVMVAFVIDKNGRPDSVTVVQSVSPELDAEAVKAINAMPRWKPGIKNGKPVRVSYTVPINFTGPVLAIPDTTKKL